MERDRRRETHTNFASIIGFRSRHDYDKGLGTRCWRKLVSSPVTRGNVGGCMVLAAATAVLTIGCANALVSPMAKASISRPRTTTVIGVGPSQLPLAAGRGKGAFGKRRKRSASESLIRRNMFWDGVDETLRTKTLAGAKRFEPPVPEGFPPASTLLRPRADKSLKHFLDVPGRRFKKNKPSLWQRIRFRTYPLGHLPRRVKLLKIVLGGQDELSLDSVDDSRLDLFGITTALKTAAHDPRIKAVLLDVSGSRYSGSATIMELRRAMDYYTQSGKPLWGFSRGALTLRQHCVMGGCTKRVASPDSSVGPTGLSFAYEFYGGLLDKIGIEPNIRRIGEFKSYGDTLTRDCMSEAQREVDEGLLSSLSDFMVGTLARDTDRTWPQVEDFVYNRDGGISVESARRFGLLDQVLHKDEMRDQIKAELSASKGKSAAAKMTRKENDEKRKKKVPKLSKATVSVAKYLKKTRRNPVEGVPGGVGDKTIAVLNAEGGIEGPRYEGTTNIGVSTVREQVNRILRNDKIDGVVLRINCGGGDALGSDLLSREVQRLRESGRTVVASICDVAASGGYIIAMGCESIVCDETSLTGSIGVVTGRLSYGKLMDEVGLKVERVSRGKYAEIGATERRPTPEEDVYVSTEAMQGYNRFVAQAALARGMSFEDMGRRAQGRVWTGSEAKVLGLVDELGGLDRAIEVVCRDLIDVKDTSGNILRKAKKEEAAAARKTKSISNKKRGKEPNAEDDKNARVNGNPVLPNAAVLAGPLGMPRDDFSGMEAKVIAEAEQEVRLAREQRNKKGEDRETRVRNIPLPRSGLLSTIIDTVPPSRRRVGGRRRGYGIGASTNHFMSSASGSVKVQTFPRAAM